MTIDEHETTFAGLPLEDYAAGSKVDGVHAWAIRVDFDAETPWLELFEALVSGPGASDLRAFVVGNWGEVATGDGNEEVVKALVAAAPKLPKLEAVFVGDLTFEETEISWIHQADMSPIFEAYPRLTHFRVRGGDGLALGDLKHASLRSLVVETGGLDAAIVREVAAAELPALEHLELWLGDSGYGATWTLEDLAPILEGARFPALRSLALRDSEQADAVAQAVAASPLMARLEKLDLSLGTLGDAGAKALLASPAIRHLKRLDVHHHYLSEEVISALMQLGIDVDVSEGEPPVGPEERYVAVSE